MNTQYLDIMEKVVAEVGCGELYPSGDEDGTILIVNSTDDMKKLNQAFKVALQEANIDTYPDYSHDDWYVSVATGDLFGYYDSYTYCDGCQKMFRTDSIGCTLFWNDYENCYRFCEDCVREEPEVYIRHLIDNPEAHNVMVSEGTLEKYGFRELEETYFNGMYQGMNDNPQKIFDKLKEDHPEWEIIFDGNNGSVYNPFMTEFTVWVREIQ